MTQDLHKNHSPGFLKVAEAAREKIIEISQDQYLQKVEDFKQKGGILLDVREDHEWAEGHLPQAIHLGRGILERDIEALVPDPGTPLVVYCGGGYRSALAALSLKVMGYTQVWSLSGGYRLWVANQRPVEKPILKKN
jgi:rhodanese-related sulfurtransferase